MALPTFTYQASDSTPITFKFTYDGEVTSWGTERLISINPLSNTADPIDGRLKISDLTVTFADTDAAIWGSIGNGTGAFNKEFWCDVFVGGAMNWINGDFQKYNEQGISSFPMHRGKIREVSRDAKISSNSGCRSRSTSCSFRSDRSAKRRTSVDLPTWRAPRMRMGFLIEVSIQDSSLFMAWRCKILPQS